MKRLIASAMLIGLLFTAVTAFANPISFQVAGSLDSNLRADVTGALFVNGLWLSIQNTSTTQGSITGFAYNMPNNIQGMDAVYTLAAPDNWNLLNQPLFINNTPPANGVPTALYVPNSIVAAPYGLFDVGMGTGPSFNNGIPGLGIANGDSVIFSMFFREPGNTIGNVNLSSIVAALTQPGGFVARFEGTTFEGGDVGTTTAPTPLPAAVWLLGSGLLGFMGFKRSRKTSSAA